MGHPATWVTTFILAQVWGHAPIESKPCKKAALGDPVDYINIEGLKIAYRRAGEGAALVLLHGVPTHSGELRQQVEGLFDQFNVIAWDMPGCGQSSDPPEQFQVGTT